MRFKHLVFAFSFVGIACASSTPSAPEKAAAEPGQARTEAAQPAAEEEGSEQTAAAAPAQPADRKKDDAPPVHPTEGDKDSAPICRYETSIGSNIKKRVCRTREQIAREEREAQEMHRRATRATKVNPN